MVASAWETGEGVSGTQGIAKRKVLNVLQGLGQSP